MYRVRIGLLLVVLMSVVTSHGAGAKAFIDITPIVETYERCVEGSGPALAYSCSSNVAMRYELEWPGGDLDPKDGPVYVEGGVVVCSFEENVLALGIIDKKGNTVLIEVDSPSACSGESTGQPGIPLRVEINPAYDPKVGPTSIWFDFASGPQHRMGLCAATTGNLSVFKRSSANIDKIIVITYAAPIWCSETA